MIILDTNVISELMRANPAPAVVQWFQQERSDHLYTTAITVAEILYGIELLPEGKRRAALQAGAEIMFTKVFARRIFWFENEAAYAFPRLAATRRKRGRPMAELDAQIAAIAEVRGAALATRNIEDFEGCGISLINPWSDSSLS